jgi:hypothetical protein
MEGDMARRAWKAPRVVLITLLTLAASPAGVAQADAPTQFQETFSETFVIPAGERCDFDYQISFTLTFHDIVFGEDLDNPERLISHSTVDVSHTNVDTGYTLTEALHGTFFLSAANNEGKQVGIVWKLRTPEGELVFIQVGQVRFTLDEDEFTKITPHILLATDSDPIVCALLGGGVASP